jgi:Raf kinase inhibitor-like YbhB/YbcL family protein
MKLRLKDLEISSPAFSHLGSIPKKYTSDGDNISPPIRWQKVPPDTKQLVLICHDPDAPLPFGFTHWCIYNIPPDVTELPEGGGAEFTEGVNTADSEGYTGPAPPSGHGIHHYYFWLYALDDDLDLDPDWDSIDLIDAIADHVIAQARLIGTYER